MFVETFAKCLLKNINLVKILIFKNNMSQLLTHAVHLVVTVSTF